MRFRAVREWGRFPRGWRVGDVAGVAVDSRDRVHVLTRGEHPVIVLDPDGEFLGSWGEGVIACPHGISIDEDDTVYIADNTDHTLRIFEPDGTPRIVLGTPGVPQDSGWMPWTVPVQRSTGPFNGVANSARRASGNLYVVDGYGNARVHVFDPRGELLASWGEPGSGPGRFRLPHGIAVDAAGRVLVADRENSRIQILDADGRFRSEITTVSRPDDLAIDDEGRLYVAELGFTAGVVPNGLGAAPPPGPVPAARVTVRTPTGEILTQLEPDPESSPRGFVAPHGICLDSAGAVYVGEVAYAATRGYSGPRTDDEREFRTLHKFEPESE